MIIFPKSYENDKATYFRNSVNLKKIKYFKDTDKCASL